MADIKSNDTELPRLNRRPSVAPAPRTPRGFWNKMVPHSRGGVTSAPKGFWKHAALPDKE